MPMRFCCLTILFLAFQLTASSAGSLRVAPTTLDLIAPDSAAVLRLRNDAETPMRVQVRVFRWSQTGGQDRFEPTRDVVASPPATQLSPGVDYTIRVVRTARTPVRREESYRVVVDQLPDPAKRRAGAVNLVVRHSIPVFFRAPDAAPARVALGLVRMDGQLLLVARNQGASRLRLADVVLLSGAGVVGRDEGLTGYVLGGASMQWPIRTSGRVGAGPLVMRAQSHLGPIETSLAIQRR